VGGFFLLKNDRTVAKNDSAEGIMGRFRTVGRLASELVQFMKEDKLWWMSPILVLLLLVGSLLIVVQGSALAPLIYAMF
jgi:fluoride ion exporter CrcB/FEX